MTTRRPPSESVVAAYADAPMGITRDFPMPRPSWGYQKHRPLSGDHMVQTRRCPDPLRVLDEFDDMRPAETFISTAVAGDPR